MQGIGIDTLHQPRQVEGARALALALQGELHFAKKREAI
jgi:hypothetical protein